MESGGRTLVIGHLTIDDIVLPSGESCMNVPGGDSLYAALGAGLWGLNPSMISCRAETYSQHILDQIEEMGIDTSFLQEVPVNGVRQWALYDTTGGRQYHLQQHASSYYDISPRPANMLHEPTVVSVAHVAPMPGYIQKEWVEWLVDRKCPWILLDPHEDELSDRSLWIQILSHVEVFMPSLVEVRALLGSDVNPVHAARLLADWGPKIVILKMGDRGSLYYDRETNRVVAIPAVPVAVKDVTGCGDAFCGGFMAGLCTLGDPRTAATWGAVSASYVLEGYGPSAILRATTKDARARWDATNFDVDSEFI